MKLLFIISLLFVFSISCKTPQSHHSEKSKRREAFIYSFKMTYFKKMLLAGFNSSTDIKNVLEADHSNYGEIVLSMEDFNFIDSLVSVDKSIIVADSVASNGRVAEGAHGKRVFDQALFRFQSKWLKRVAAKRSRSYTNM